MASPSLHGGWAVSMTVNQHCFEYMTTLPDFDRPPVVEVALSVSFDPLPRVTAADLGALWQQHFRTRGFEFTADHPPLTVTPEQFNPAAGPPTFRVQMITATPPPRMWFHNENGTELVQVQSNWFGRNWRKSGTNESYPRYPRVRSSFEEDLAVLDAFLRSEELGLVVPRLGEITYVNHIVAGEGWDTIDHVEQVLNLASASWQRRFLPSPEFTRLSTQFIIPDGDDRPIGRLYIAAEPAFREQDGAPMLLLTLTARGNLPREGFDGLREFMEIGHLWVVQGFLDITTARMHDVWGLKYANG